MDEQAEGMSVSVNSILEAAQHRINSLNQENLMLHASVIELKAKLAEATKE